MFPLSSKSADRFSWQAVSECTKPEPGRQPGSRDGVINLYRLPSDQLSFLEQYVAKLNEELEEHTAKLADDWRASLDQELLNVQIKRNEEIKAHELQRKQQSEVAMQNDSDDEKDAATSTENKEPELGDDNTHTEPLPARHWSCPLGPNPALFETPWTIEDVALSFIPETVSLESVPGGAAGFATLTTKSGGSSQDGSHKAVKLEVATNNIAPESFYSFAILLSRCTGVEVPLHSGAEERATTSAPRIPPSPVLSSMVSPQGY